MNLKNLSQMSWEMIFFRERDYFYLFIAAGFFLNYIFRFSVQVRHYPYIKCLFVWGKFDFVYNKE